MNSSKQIKLGAFMSYAAIAFNIIAGLIYTPWMVRQIGKSDYGLFVLVTSFLTYFVIDFGLGQAIARFIAKYRVEKNEKKVNELLGLTTKLYLLIDLLIFVALIITYFFIENIFVQLTAVEIAKFKVVFTIAGLFSLFSFPFSSLNGILIAYERFVLLKLCDLLNKVFTISLMVVALFLGYKLFALVAINALVGVIIVGVKYFYLAKTTPIKINYRYYTKELFHELFNFSAWITVIGIAQRLLLNITPAILGIFSGTVQIAIFAIGMTIEGYTWTFANALNGLFLPRVSELSAKKENLHEISNLMIRVGRLQLFIIGLLLIGIITLGKQFIVLWMGEDFRDSYYVALLLILPGIITLTQQIGNTLIIVVNKLKYQAILFLVASFLSVLLSVLLAPAHGAIGSAIGIFTAVVLFQVVGMNIIFWKVLKLDIPRFFREAHLKMIFPLGLALIAGFLIQKYVSSTNLILFFLKAILLGLIYVLILWVLGLNYNEKKLILNTVKRIIPVKYRNSKIIK